MLIRRFLVFPTLVLACYGWSLNCYAAKVSAAPDLDDPPEEVTRPHQEQEMRKGINIADPPPAPYIHPDRAEYFYRYRHALTFDTGLTYDTVDSSNAGPLARFGTQFLFSTAERRKYEVGADLLSDGSGSISGARRFIYGEGRFRPYTKAGFAVRIVPADQLTTVLKYENYQIRGAVGFEQLTNGSMSFRLEFELMASSRSQAASLTVGTDYAW